MGLDLENKYYIYIKIGKILGEKHVMKNNAREKISHEKIVIKEIVVQRKIMLKH